MDIFLYGVNCRLSNDYLAVIISDYMFQNILQLAWITLSVFQLYLYNTNLKILYSTQGFINSKEINYSLAKYVIATHNNNINITNKNSMRQSTEQHDDKQSVSTKVAMPTKAASFTVSANRQMFRQYTKNKKIMKEFHNLLDLQPQFSAYAVTDHVHMLEDGEHFVVMHDTHYTIIADRGKPHMIAHSVQPDSQLLFSSARKPASFIFLESVYRYSNQDYQNMIHINVSKHLIQQNKTECKDTHIKMPVRADGTAANFLEYIPLQNSKRVLLLFQIQYNAESNSTEYQLIYTTLDVDNKSKNPYFIHTRRPVKKFGQQSEQQQYEQSGRPVTNTRKSTRNIYKEHNIASTKLIRKRIILNNTHQKYLKIVNSEFGDALLFVTDTQIYNLEIQDSVIQIKSVKFHDQLKLALTSHDEIKQRFDSNYSKQQRQIFYQDKIIDVDYITGGLKVIFITQNSLVGYLSAQKVTSLQSLKQIYQKKEKRQQIKYDCKKIHPMSNRLIVQMQHNLVIILKQNMENQYSSAFLSMEKTVELPLSVDEDTIDYKLSVTPKSQQLLLCKIINNTKTKAMYLKVMKKGLLSTGNQFMTLYKTGFRAIHAQPNKSSSQVSTIGGFPSVSYLDQQRSVFVAKSNGVMCIIRDHQVCFLRVFQGFTTQSNQIEELFTTHFFEKPQQVSMDPYASLVVIVFKQFVKFFKFQYADIEHFFTYDVRNVNYAGFSDNGQYLIVVSEDCMYFLNPFTYETEKTMEAYGDTKNVKFFDTNLYIVFRNKTASKNSQEMIINCFQQRQGQYEKTEQIRLQADENYYLDKNYVIVASKNQVKVYTKKNCDNESITNSTATKLKMKTKSIKFLNYYEHPTVINLCQEFGLLFIGTNYGRVYQYLWPFQTNQDTQIFEQYHFVQAHSSDICLIRVGTCLQKLYTLSKSKQVTQFQINQYIEGQQMTTPYIISPKTLYTNQLKFQFANRQYLYPAYTSYIQKYQHESNEAIEQLKFISQKLKDDLEQQHNKSTQKLKNGIIQLQSKKKQDLHIIHAQLQEKKVSNLQNIKQTQEEFSEQDQMNGQTIKKQVQQYQKTILQFYKEAERLRVIYKQQQQQFRYEKDQYQIQNDVIRKKLIEQCQFELQKYSQKYVGITDNAQQYKQILKFQDQQGDYQLKEYKKWMHKSVEDELLYEQSQKQTLLGSIQQFIKQINNYRQRRDEFETLVMETNMQIQQLREDQMTYKHKKSYLEQQLTKKQDMIEEKQKQLIVFVKNTQNMKKLKNTHEFQLHQYQKQFDPINKRLVEIDKKIKRMNEEVLNQFTAKQANQNRIKKNEQKEKQLKKLREKKALTKHQTKTKLQRLFSQLALLLQENPQAIQLQKQLNGIINGQTYKINEEQIEQRVQNAHLIRKKQFIRKEISEQEKHEQQIIRNKNLYYQYYKDNTSLVGYYNDLKKQESALAHKKQVMESRIKQMWQKVRQSSSSKVQLRRNRSEKSYSLESRGKKLSEKLLTPFQKHEQEQVQLLMLAKGNTQDTRAGTNRKKGGHGESSSLLHSLLKQLPGSESQFQKMEAVREKVRSFINPQMRARDSKKNLANMQVQKVLFESRKLSELIKQ